MLEDERTRRKKEKGGEKRITKERKNKIGREEERERERTGEKKKRKKRKRMKEKEFE